MRFVYTRRSLLGLPRAYLKEAGSGVEWLVLGSHELRPLIVPAAFDMPALVGRLDLLIHYRLILEEARGRFDLRPLRAAPRLERVSRG